MKHKHLYKIPSPITATIQRGTAIAMVFSVLFLQSGGVAYALTAPTKAQVAGAVGKEVKNTATNAVTSAVTSIMPSSSGIAGKCVGQVINQKITAYASGAVIAAISAGISLTQIPFAVPSGDLGVSSGAGLQSGEGGATTVLSWLKPMTDCLVHEASQLMISNLKMAITNAISQGLHGSPNYSSNTSQFMSSLSAMVAGGLRDQIYRDGFPLCDFTGNGSFKESLANNVGLSTRQTNSSAQNFEQKIKCPFPTTGNNTAPAFYNDFNKGGWSSFETALSDNGNPFGTALIASQELVKRQEETASLAEQQLAQGGGYFPVIDETTCDYPPDLYDHLFVPDPDTTKKNHLVPNPKIDPTELANVQRLYCKVTTPGKTVADTASKAATSAWDQLNISGAMGKTMEGFASEQAANAMDGIFGKSPAPVSTTVTTVDMSGNLINVPITTSPPSGGVTGANTQNNTPITTVDMSGNIVTIPAPAQ